MQSNRTTGGKKRLNFLADPCGLGNFVSLLFRYWTPSPIKLLEPPSSLWNRQTVTIKQLERLTPFMEINLDRLERSPRVFDVVRVSWSGSCAVPARRDREILLNPQVPNDTHKSRRRPVACTRSWFMERAVIDFHYDANCFGHDITRNTCLILTRNLVLIQFFLFVTPFFCLLLECCYYEQ